MARYVIVGAGASGLYTAWRLLKDGKLTPGTDTVELYEWSERPGGRIYTYTFPESIAVDGLYCEFGGMRFATDPHFPNMQQVTEGHLLVQNVIADLGLAGKVVPFTESPQRLYYLRGRKFYENQLATHDVAPYNFNADFEQFVATNLPQTDPQTPNLYTADNILGAVGAVFAPGLGSSNSERSAWCKYYGAGTVGQDCGTTSFPAGTPVQDIGYWNLLYDQLGDEGFDYVADGNGYTSNVINWNAADAMQANNDYGSSVSYSRLDGGYSILFQALATEVESLMKGFPGSGLHYGQQLTTLAESDGGTSTTCTFSGGATVVADQLFLAMPRRSLELVAGGCAADYMLNDPQVTYYLESSIDQPAIKAVMVFGEAWWTGAPFPPQLTPQTAQGVGGPTITDLPLRMVYYFANNIPGGPGTTGGPYVLLASYDDMNYSNFWREVEITGDYTQAPSLVRQPLTGPTEVPVNSPLAGLLTKQLAEAHGVPVSQVPTPLAVYYQDWGQDPFGGGYHGWASHYNICQVMQNIRAPYQGILNQKGPNVYIIGSCYSFDQAWVEGAFCTAESVLEQYLGLPPINGITDYTLICTQ